MADLALGERNRSDAQTEILGDDVASNGDAIFKVTAGLLLKNDITGIRASGTRGGSGVEGNGTVGVKGTGPTGVVAVGNDVGVLATGAVGVMAMATGAVSVMATGGVGAHAVGVSVGVMGECDSGTGVFGRVTSGGLAVYGRAVGKGDGVAGRSDSGAGVYGRSNTGDAVFGENPTGLGNAGFFLGKVVIEGGLVVLTGAKSAAVPHPDGSHRLLYCMESPECWFEDFGEGSLASGRCRVMLDADFAEVIETANYHVFLSPYGDSCGLYVSHRNATGFEVREQQGGQHDLTFSYRIVARRKDLSAGRLAKVDLPERSPPELPSQPSIPELPSIPSPAGKQAGGGNGPWEEHVIDRFMAVEKDKFQRAAVSAAYESMVRANLLDT